MKYLTLLFLVFEVFQGKSQNYFDSTTYYFFSNVDSNNIDYRFHIPSTAGLYIAGPKHNGTFTDSAGNTHIIMQPHINLSEPIVKHYSYKNTNAGMLGREIIENNQSITFLNIRNQHIVLQLNMNINDSCLLLSYDTLKFYATRLNDENRFIINNEYKVERYHVHALNNNGLYDDNHPFHNQIIEISKGLGIVSGISMATLPFHANPLQYKLVGFTSFTKQINEGYTFYINPFKSYSVGDEFHWKQQSSGRDQHGFDDSEIQKVIGKDTTKSGHIGYIFTTETYTLISRGFNMPPPQKDVEHTYETDTIYYSLNYIPISSPFDHFQPHILTDYMVNSNDSENLYNKFTSTYSINEMLKVVGYGDYSSNIVYDRETNSWMPSVNAGQFYDEQTFYGIGIKPYDLNSLEFSHSSGRVKRYFVYVHKNGAIWGTPFLFHLSVNKTSNVPLSIEIYPNPAKDEITITSLNKSNPFTQISLNDIAGKLLLNNTNIGTETQLQLPTLTAGIYFINVTFQNKATVTRKLIIQ